MHSTIFKCICSLIKWIFWVSAVNLLYIRIVSFCLNSFSVVCLLFPSFLLACVHFSLSFSLSILARGEHESWFAGWCSFCCGRFFRILCLHSHTQNSLFIFFIFSFTHTNPAHTCIILYLSVARFMLFFLYHSFLKEDFRYSSNIFVQFHFFCFSLMSFFLLWESNFFRYCPFLSPMHRDCIFCIWDLTVQNFDNL